jgi:hypothetical protein
MIKQTLAMLTLFQFMTTLNDYNIYADYILNPEIQIYLYNQTIDKISVKHGNETLKDENITLQRVNEQNRQFHISVDNSLLNLCEKYNHSELFVTKCGFSVNDLNGSEMLQFSLLNFKYQNTTQSLVDYEVGNNLAILPSQINKYFDFFDCKDLSCRSGEVLHPNYRQYNFKINIQEDFLKNYELTLLKGYIAVKREDSIIFYMDVTQLLKQDKFLYTLALDTFPERFDVYLTYSVMRTGDNKVRLTFNCSF